MKKNLLAIFGVLLAGWASAITMSWEWDSYGALSSDSDSFYLVYSETKLDAQGAANQALASQGSGSATMGSLLDGASLDDTNSNSVDFNGLSAVSGYYYMVVFNTNPATGEASYSVAQAGSVNNVATQDGQVTFGTGAGEVNPDEIPNDILFTDPTWISWGYRDAAPEPTALALLALGAAGLALRRKVA